MPSKSQRQHNLMEMLDHNPSIAKQKGISPKVAKEFVEADKASGKFRKKKKAR